MNYVKWIHHGDNTEYRVKVEVGKVGYWLSPTTGDYHLRYTIDQ